MCNEDCNKCLNNCEDKKFPLITSVFLTLTEACVLKCTYCFCKQNPREMTFDIAKKAVDMILENSKKEKVTPAINFFGGEPLMKWDEIIVPIIEYIRKDLKVPFGISMTTNGILLDEDKLIYMKNNNIGILFSIDGDKETQDKNRPFHSGASSFDNLEDTIPLVLKYYPNATFRATIANDTVQNTFHNMKFADNCGYNNMYFTPNMFTRWSKKEKEELKKQMRLFSDWYIDYARKGKLVRLSPFDDKIKKIRMINNECKNERHREIFSKIIGQGKCGLGANRNACVGTDGVIYGCQEMTSNTGDIFIIGDVFNGVDDNKRLKLATSFNKKNVKGKNCRSCKLDNICDGGCVANNFMITGDVNKPPEMWCFWEQLLLEEAIYVCNILGNEENKLFRNAYFGGDYNANN